MCLQFILKEAIKVMLNLNSFGPAANSRHQKKRIGRGHGSGNGKTAGKGHKGQKARSGGSIRWGFEGGQMPLQRRVPKRGFNNIFAKSVAAINVSRLEIFKDGTLVNRELLKSSGLVKRKFDYLKILGNGNLTKKLNVHADMFSAGAKLKIENVGGTTEVIQK
jgi:large subunit ribosomal protein L15